MDDRSVDIAKLRIVVNRVLDFIENDLGHREVQLKENFYWSPPDEELYSMQKPPAQLDCGSLFDDLDFIESGYEDPDQALPLTLMHVAPIMHFLATAVPSYKK